MTPKPSAGPVAFVVADHDARWEPALRARGWRTRLVDARVSPDALIDLLERSGGIDLVLVDRPGADPAWEAAVRARTRRLVVLDPDVDRPHECDLVLSPTIETKRVVRAIYQRLFGDLLALRRARPEDVQTVFELSNDPVVRSVSFSSDEIRWEDHQRWFAHKLSDPSCLFLIVEFGGLFCGQIRLDQSGSDATISLSFTNETRGLGFGGAAIPLAIGIVRRERPEVREIIAFVKTENQASMRVFEKTGFALREEVGGKCRFVFPLTDENRGSGGATTPTPMARS